MRTLLQIRKKQIEDLKQRIRTKKRETEKTIIYTNTIGDFDLCLPIAKDILNLCKP